MTDILRRPEYRRKRKYKARARKRHTMDRIMREMLKGVYESSRLFLSLTTPFLDAFGSVRTDNYANHLAERAVHPDGTEAVSAHSGGSGRAPASLHWGGNVIYWDVVTQKPSSGYVS